MLVQKFGGTSVETLEKIKDVAKFVCDKLKVHDKSIVVVSAMGKTTNNLTAEICELSNTPPKREVDQLLSIGETKSSALLSTALCDLGVNAISLTGWQAGIFTDKTFGGAFIEDIEESVLMRFLQDYDVLVVTGFQGVTINGDVTTLGKGGSDTTAVALASTFGCKCEIYTDVEGIFTVDPKVLPNAKKLERISYAELMESSASGAKVMETRSIEIASKYNTELYVAKSLEEKRGGTIVSAEIENFEAMPIKGLVLQEDNSLLNVYLNGQNNLAKLFEIFAQASQKIQGATNDKNIFVCLIEEKNKKNIENLLKKYKFKYKIKKQGLKITLVGSGFQTHSLALKNIISWLGEERVEIYNISISEISLMFLIDIKDKEKTVKILSEKLGL